MARLVAVCRTDDYQFDRRQLPLAVDDNLKMVVQFSDNCVDCENVRGIKRKDMEHFVQRFSMLSKDEIAVEMMVTSQDILNMLAHMVPCVGCRRSVERLFSQLVEGQHSALEPLIITRKGVLSVNREFLFDPKALYALFYIHGAKFNSMMDSIPKSKKNKRCNLHSLETHKNRTTGSWIDIWDLLAQECREEVVLVDADSLLETLENYLRKHRFCSECKAKVLRAYSILVGDLDCNTEKGYCAVLYEGLRCCPQERHIHMQCETDFIAHLIGRAEPELAGGSRRDRHAKTLDIAQEEVLTCLGIHIYERLHRIWQKLKAEEQTWQILFYLGVDALKKSFEMAMERKQGISNLELICEELLEEERAKEQKREQKRQKRKKKKAKSAQIVDPTERQCEETSVQCECDKTQSNGNDKKTHKSCSDKCRELGDQNSNTTLASMESCRISGTPERQMKNGSMNSDCGYSSDVEGCECSMPSSNEGSDILCDGRCSSHDGGDSVCESLIDRCNSCSNSVCHGPPRKHDHSYCTHKPKNDSSAPSENCKCASGSPSLIKMSLQDMLEAPGTSDDEDFISEEEIQMFKANQSNLLLKRQELRETLRKRFDTLQQQRSPDTGSLDPVAQKMCNL
uniref:Gametogenetin-binding protein 2 n=1 Tax=Magallana gigas TaxID=29159 RepID=K1S3Z7_MAGGI